MFGIEAWIAVLIGNPEMFIVSIVCALICCSIWMAIGGRQTGFIVILAFWGIIAVVACPIIPIFLLVILLWRGLWKYFKNKNNNSFVDKSGQIIYPIHSTTSDMCSKNQENQVVEIVFEGGFLDGEHRTPKLSNYKHCDCKYFSKILKNQTGSEYSKIIFSIKDGVIHFDRKNNFWGTLGKYTDSIFYEHGILQLNLFDNTFRINELVLLTKNNNPQNTSRDRYLKYQINLDGGEILLSESGLATLLKAIDNYYESLHNYPIKIDSIKGDFVELKFFSDAVEDCNFHRANFESFRVSECKESNSYEQFITFKVYRNHKVTFTSERRFNWANHAEEYSFEGRTFFESGEIPISKQGNKYCILGLKKRNFEMEHDELYTWEITLPFGKFYFSEEAIESLNSMINTNHID